ncbi:MAG: small, acid-soluble spore protein, alpha/beta type, partial [Peptostreptococcaceae bacterium]
MDNNKLTKELIEKCEKTKKGANKKNAKPLTDNDIMKYEIASELGLIDKVSECGWAGLTAKEAGRIG